MRISTSSEIEGKISARIVDITYHDLLGQFVVQVGWETALYLSRADAYTLLSSLESAIHEYEQATCEHPIPMTIWSDTELSYCGVCGCTLEVS